VVLYNTIIWDNEGSAVGVYAEEDDGFSWIGVDFSDIEGGRDGIALVGNAGMYWNPGNIDSDPLFIDPDNGDFHLTEDSPCIDAGAPESPHDPDNTRADMGAYFFPNYGEGSPQIVVDPGALDFPIGENLQPEAELTIGNVGNRVLRFWTYAGETDPEWAWDNDFDWLEWEPRAGEVEPGEETIMNVMIDARDMIIDFGGVRRNLYISSNDPDNPVIVVGIFIHLTIAVWSEEAGFPDMMDWNAVYDVMELNNDYEIDFRIDGIMPDRLVVDEIRLDSPVFAVDQNGFELDPWESRGMTVTFRTAERGEFEATMFIISNNWENREFPVQLHAKIPINPPDIRDNVNWWIALNAGVGDCQDNDNYAGGAEGASFDFDEDFDLPEPPHAPDRYVQLYFPHPDWENLLGDNFTSDIAPDSAQWETIIVWDFEVNTDQTDQAVTLGFDYSEEIDQGFNLVLFDVETEETVNLWENQTYEYDAGEGGVHQFQLTYGDLVPPVVTVTQPNGGENLHPGDLVNVIWEAEDLTGVVGSVLYLSIERGLNWTQIGSTEGADFDLEWEIPDLYSPY
jgi:hypothetical protein